MQGNLNDRFAARFDRLAALAATSQQLERVLMNFLKLAIVVCFLISLTARADSSTQDATWKSRSVKFTYSGFTTGYSCNGLHEKVRKIVLAMGARQDDLRIDDSTCGPDASRPSAVLSLTITFATLQLATAGDLKPLQSHWKHIDVGQAAQLDLGDC